MYSREKGSNKKAYSEYGGKLANEEELDEDLVQVTYLCSYADVWERG